MCRDRGTGDRSARAADAGRAEAVDDAITGATVGIGPRVNVPFRLGETRLFKARERER